MFCSCFSASRPLRRVARIEEVNRIIEVLESIGVKCRWLEHNDLEINPPKRLDLANMDVEATKRTRSIIMFLGPLLHQYSTFELPFSGGCNIGTRTVEPHMTGLAPFGLSVQATSDRYVATSKPQAIDRAIVLTEREPATNGQVCY
jgi:UDP-N-acetylglucosamine transferase